MVSGEVKGDRAARDSHPVAAEEVDVERILTAWRLRKFEVSDADAAQEVVSGKSDEGCIVSDRRIRGGLHPRIYLGEILDRDIIRAKVDRQSQLCLRKGRAAHSA